MKLKNTLLASALLSATAFSVNAATELTPEQAAAVKPFDRVVVTGRFNAIGEAVKAVSRRADKEGAASFYVVDTSDFGNSGNWRVVADLYKADAEKAEETSNRVINGVVELPKDQAVLIEPFDTVTVQGFYRSQPEVNDAITKAAKAKGAMALFGEKYADVVRVLTMGDFSVELCGGIHAKRTGDIGLFKIVAETAVAAGIRRIEAVTGENAINWLHNQQRILTQSADLFKSDVNTLVEKIQQLQDKAKKAEKELQGLKEKAAMQAGSDLVKSAVKINDVSVIVHQLDGIETKSLRVMVDDLKNQLGSGVIVFASILDDKVNLVVGVTSDLTTKVKAGELVNLMAQQVGGKGGGRPDMAMAGGSQPENVNLALTVAQNWLSNNL